MGGDTESLVIQYLLEGLLHQDMEKRFTAEQVLKVIDAKRDGKWAPPESCIELPQSAVLLSPRSEPGSPVVRLSASAADNLSTSSTAKEDIIDGCNATRLAREVEVEGCKVATKAAHAIELEAGNGAAAAIASSDQQQTSMLKRLYTPFKPISQRLSSALSPTVRTNNKRVQTPSSPPSVPDLR